MTLDYEKQRLIQTAEKHGIPLHMPPVLRANYPEGQNYVMMPLSEYVAKVSSGDLPGEMASGKPFLDWEKSLGFSEKDYRAAKRGSVNAAKQPRPQPE